MGVSPVFLLFHFIIMFAQSVPFANIDIESFFYECKTGEDVLRVLNELVGE